MTPADPPCRCAGCELTRREQELGLTLPPWPCTEADRRRLAAGVLNALAMLAAAALAATVVYEVLR